MPPFSSSTSSSSVFGRWTGKRQPSEPASIDEDAASPPLPASAADNNDRSPYAHRRESSILSLHSVQDLGHNVRRSVSLRSRPPPGGPGSGGLNTPRHTARSPSTGNLLTSPLPPTSPVDDEVKPLPPAPAPPRSRGKLSITRGLSTKFKSAETLPTLGRPLQTDDDDPHRPPTAVEIPKTPSMLATPALFQRADGKPALQSQTSFSRDNPSSNGLQPPGTAPAGQGGGINPRIIYQQIHEVAAKRMATIDYMRKVHDGNVFYFNTLHYSPANLQALPSLQPFKLARRANNYLALGYSLPALQELNAGSALEYLKALATLLQEFDTYQNLGGSDSGGMSLSKGRMGQMFKSGMGLGGRGAKGRRSSTATDSIAMSSQSADLLGLPRSGGDAADATSPVHAAGHDFQHLAVPHLSFDPDFGTVFATLCDSLIDAYAKLLELVAGPDTCSPAVGEAFAKADKAVRKILVANVAREFEDGTRAGVKGEVAGLGKLVLGGLM